MTRNRHGLTALATVLVLIGLGSAALLLPTTTLQGVNYKVTTYRIPAYVKTIDFLQRHYQYELLVSRICAGSRSPDECVKALFDWTHRSIRPTPAALPVVDDHPLHIVIRGYGQSDQMADVFVTLAVYAGVPAFLRFFKDAHGNVLVLSFVRLDGRWVVFDVMNHIAFRRLDGGMADVEDIARDPSLLDEARLPGDVPYSAFVTRSKLVPFIVPQPLRAELQQPWPRMRYEARRVLGLEKQVRP